MREEIRKLIFKEVTFRHSVPAPDQFSIIILTLPLNVRRSTLTSLCLSSLICEMAIIITHDLQGGW